MFTWLKKIQPPLPKLQGTLYRLNKTRTAEWCLNLVHQILPFGTPRLPASLEEKIFGPEWSRNSSEHSNNDDVASTASSHSLRAIARSLIHRRCDIDSKVENIRSESLSAKGSNKKICLKAMRTFDEEMRRERYLFENEPKVCQLRKGSRKMVDISNEQTRRRKTLDAAW